MKELFRWPLELCEQNLRGIKRIEIDLNLKNFLRDLKKKIWYFEYLIIVSKIYLSILQNEKSLFDENSSNIFDFDLNSECQDSTKRVFF